MSEQTSTTLADAAAIVRRAYMLILGRSPDPVGLDAFVRPVERGDLSVEELYTSLVTSEEFATRAARADTGAWPDRRETVPPGAVDVRELIAHHSLDEHRHQADDYFVTHAPELEHLLSMPLAKVDETPGQLAMVAQILGVLRPLPGMRVLDFGAGSCWMSRILSQMNCDVVACDASSAALDIGRELYERLPPIGSTPPPTFLVFDGEHFDLEDESIDRIVCLDAFHHVPNQDQVLAEFWRVLRDGGIAAMGEPGPRHSLSPQSQHEMRHYDVIENDVLMSEIEPLARAAGFSEVKLAIPPAPTCLLSPRDYVDGAAAGTLPMAYGEELCATARDTYRIFLYKGDPRPPDSRDRQGLACELQITLERSSYQPGEAMVGRYSARNVGSNVWLHSDADFGRVEIGVHICSPEGHFLQHGFASLSRGEPTLPGQMIEGVFEMAAPGSGSYELRFDLASHRVSWFASNSGRTVDIPITVV